MFASPAHGISQPRTRRKIKVQEEDDVWIFFRNA